MREQLPPSLAAHDVAITVHDRDFAAPEQPAEPNQRGCAPALEARLAASAMPVWTQHLTIARPSPPSKHPGCGPGGEDCTHWTLDYAMCAASETAGWLIDRVTFHNGTPGHRPCV